MTIYPIEYTYGELTEKGLVNLLNEVNTKGKIFYDLGSGKGNVLKYAAKNFDSLKQIVGIEIIKERHEQALLNTKPYPKISLYNDSFFSNKYNYNDADIIYISNLCFSKEMNKKLNKKISEEVKPGSIIFSSKQLELTRDTTHKSITTEQTWSPDSNIHMLIVN